MKRILPYAALLGLLAGACDSSDPVAPLQPSPLTASPMLVSAGGFVELSAGHEHTCALRTDGSVACWGLDQGGPVTVPPALRPATHVTSGWNHSCALHGDGGVTCWGYNGQGQTSVPAGLGAAKAIDAGGGHTCALQLDNTAVCWGGSSYTNEGRVPAGLGPVQQVSAGWHHTCVLKPDGTVLCWGVNTDGQSSVPPGLANVTQVSAGENETCVLLAGGSVQCWGGRGLGVASPPASLGVATYVEANHAHACAIKSDGTVACWGYAALGAIDVPSNLAGVTQLTTGGYHSCAITTDTRVTCWGLPLNGRTTPPATRVAPVATFTAPLGVREGSPIALALANASVPGYIGNAGLTFAFDCGDGAGYGAYAAANLTNCPTVDNGTRTVRAIVRDVEGDWQDYSRTVIIENAAPQPMLSGSQWTTPGQPYTLTLGVVDPGSADAPWRYAVYWGDESPAATGALQSIATPITITHAWAMPGMRSILVRVTDKDGAMRSSTMQVSVRFAFSGFLAPIAASPGVNEVTAGASIPIKFSLGGDYGMGVFSPNSGVQRVSCVTGDRIDDVVRPNIIASSYDIVPQRYEFVWKTDQTWAHNCYRLVVRLSDGTMQTADFRFR